MTVNCQEQIIGYRLPNFISCSVVSQLISINILRDLQQKKHVSECQIKLPSKMKETNYLETKTNDLLRDNNKQLYIKQTLPMPSEDIHMG